MQLFNVSLNLHLQKSVGKYFQRLSRHLHNWGGDLISTGLVFTLPEQFLLLNGSGSLFVHKCTKQGHLFTHLPGAIRIFVAFWWGGVKGRHR